MAIAIVGMLDEREEALRLLKTEIESRGHKTTLVDITIGTGGISPSLKADITCEDIAQAGGTTIDDVRGMLSKQREKAVSSVANGLSEKMLALYGRGDLEGVIAVGGMTGTFICLTMMRALPFGMPKLLLSSVAAMPRYAGRFSEYFGVRDITVMHTVVDTVGFNPLVKSLMMNGAHAICGMAEGLSLPEKEERPSIALTEFGFCDEGAQYVRELLEQKNYNIISFHAQGMGDKAAEDLVGQGLFEAFIDLVPAALSEYLFGGNRAAGPDRLEAACRQGIPYIVTPCGFDMISCGPLERRDKDDPLWVSRNLAERQLLVQDAMRVQARTTEDEVREIARAVAEKLNGHKEKKLVKFLIPAKGFSSLSKEGGALYNPDIDRVFIDEVKKVLDQEIEVLEVDAHINTREFAQAVVESLEEVFEHRTKVS
ncbi:MAG: Tm-1-like ATP-binding domain-containing protein [Dehalococcoidia bacterium]